MVRTWTLSETDGRYALWLTEDATRGTVTTYDAQRGQVGDAMPRDRPDGGGRWYAPMSDRGISYVSPRPYSARHARRVYRSLVAAE